MISVRRLPISATGAVYLGGAVLMLTAMRGPHSAHSALELATVLVLTVPAAALGLLLARRVPENPCGPAVVALAASPLVTYAIENWGGSYRTGSDWPGAAFGAAIADGAWTLIFAGFVVLCLAFPDGARRGGAARWAIPAMVAAPVLQMLAVAIPPGRHAGGAFRVSVPRPLGVAIAVSASLALLAALVGAVAEVVARYRGGDARRREQIRWLLFAAASVPVGLSSCGVLAVVAGLPAEVTGVAMLTAILVVVPAAVAVAVLRHDLFDLDRLISSSVAWLLTTLAAAAGFAVAVLALAEAGRQSERVSVTAAAFTVALVLLPLHRRLHAAAGRVFDRERTVLHGGVQRFVQQVRDGQAQPEQVEALLRRLLRDPCLRLLVTLPGESGYIGLDGAPALPPPAATVIPIQSGSSQLGVLALGEGASARRRRQGREMVVAARLPLEVARLQLGLRAALRETQAGRARLVEAVSAERVRLARDLHDGAQQQIVAVGMRLRSMQRRHVPGSDDYAEFDLAVRALQSTVDELRRIAHGVRPSRLDDGLAAAIRSLLAEFPLPVELDLADVSLAEPVATTAYFVVAEALANALKHADASTVVVNLQHVDGTTAVTVRDDGRGGAGDGAGIVGLRVRVNAVGGRFEIDSPPGCGTTVRAVF